MYSGIIEHRGTIEEIIPFDQGIRLRVMVPKPLQQPALGASIAINGVCLTVTESGNGTLLFDVMRISLEKTTLGGLKKGDVVHVESSMKVGDELGGHFIYGHVNGITTIESLEVYGDSTLIWFAVPQGLADYIVLEGAVCLDGVSLTVARRESDRFAVSFIPHTLEVTHFGEVEPGMNVNVEVDMIAKYAIDAIKLYERNRIQ